jgi:hypothetical protein
VMLNTAFGFVAHLAPSPGSHCGHTEHFAQAPLPPTAAAATLALPFLVEVGYTFDLCTHEV